MTKNISKKEELFCQNFIRLCNLKDAAKASGYTDKKAMELMTKKTIISRFSEIASKDLPDKMMSLQALKRLAFSPINDGAALAVSIDKLSKEVLAELDLFCVSGISRGKSGKIEVKFYDRLKAIELLLNYEKDSDSEGLSSLLNALDMSNKTEKNCEKHAV